MTIKFYTTDWCGDCTRSKSLLNKLNINFDEINVDTNSDANEYITKLQNNQRRIPVIVFEDGTYLVEPTDPELLEKINSYQN
ncbi:MAG: glutaredoxin family protein [Candidatus Actinomarina sp.]|tara:strand:- start:763 stop:1008 length:246 start_codon:yes stop_codon:yes gene_type:complete